MQCFKDPSLCPFLTSPCGFFFFPCYWANIAHLHATCALPMSIFSAFIPEQQGRRKLDCPYPISIFLSLAVLIFFHIHTFDHLLRRRDRPKGMVARSKIKNKKKGGGRRVTPQMSIGPWTNKHTVTQWTQLGLSFFILTIVTQTSRPCHSYSPILNCFFPPIHSEQKSFFSSAYVVPVPFVSRFFGRSDASLRNDANPSLFSLDSSLLQHNTPVGLPFLHCSDTSRLFTR